MDQKYTPKFGHVVCLGGDYVGVIVPVPRQNDDNKMSIIIVGPEGYSTKPDDCQCCTPEELLERMPYITRRAKRKEMTAEQHKVSFGIRVAFGILTK